MRRPILLAIIIVILNGCASKQEYIVEDALMECFKDQYQQIGIDITKSIDSANFVFLDFNVMPEVKGTSFIKMIEGIKEHNGLPFEPTPELIESLEKVKTLPTSISCADSAFFFDFDSTEIYNSKFMSFVAIFDSIEQRRDISVQMIASDFLAAFDERDFDHPLYSAVGTLALSNLIKAQHDTDLLNLLPPSTTTVADLPDSLKVILGISMLEGDKILINGDVTERSNIVEYILQFIEKNEPSGIVKISAERSVSYQLYINVLDDVNFAYDSYYNKKSENIYGIEFTKLTSEQRREIKSKYPKLISISEPGL